MVVLSHAVSVKSAVPVRVVSDNVKVLMTNMQIVHVVAHVHNGTNGQNGHRVVPVVAVEDGRNEAVNARHMLAVWVHANNCKNATLMYDVHDGHNGRNMAVAHWHVVGAGKDEPEVVVAMTAKDHHTRSNHAITNLAVALGVIGRNAA